MNPPGKSVSSATIADNLSPVSLGSSAVPIASLEQNF